MTAAHFAVPAFRPLHGVRVLDFASTLAGPYAGMILAQLGADVVKVEALSGDDSRKWPASGRGWQRCLRPCERRETWHRA